MGELIGTHIAVLKPLMHRFVYGGEIREGSYVMLDNYTLAFGKKLIGKGQVAYLAIADIHTVGYRQRYARVGWYGKYGLLRELPEDQQQPPKRSKLGTRFPKEVGEYAVFKDPAADDNVLGFISRFDDGSLYQGGDDNLESDPAPAPTGAVNKRKHESVPSPLGYRSPNEVPMSESRRTVSSSKADQKKPRKSEVQEVGTLRKPSSVDTLPQNLNFYESQVVSHNKRCLEKPVAHARLCHCKVCEDVKAARRHSGNSQPSSPPSKKAPWQPTKYVPTQPNTSLSQQAILALESGRPLKRITKPLQLYPLSSMSGPRKSQNKIGDYFAVIDWVDNKTIARFRMSLKRDLRIVDPSTQKKVLLSVFADPLNFTPAVGTVALFRNLRTHEWDGGSLDAYQKDCEGFEWFIPNPVGVEGCDVRAMREWYEMRQEEERDERKAELRVRELMGEKKIAGRCHASCVQEPDSEFLLEAYYDGLCADVDLVDDASSD